MLLPESLDQFVTQSAPPHDELQTEMAREARERNFPIIGRAAGGFLQTLASARQAESIFEFGSGFGYSASWFLKGLAPSGELVLTERDADNVEQARSFLERSGDADHVRFEAGDALEIVERYDGPFDIVLLDHDKADYHTAFEQVFSKLATGGVILADNILRGPVHYEELLPHLVDGQSRPDDPTAAGLLEYLRTVHDHPDCHSVVLPIGNGIAMTTRVT